jgi:hypothetical protein
VGLSSVMFAACDFNGDSCVSEGRGNSLRRTEVGPEDKRHIGEHAIVFEPDDRGARAARDFPVRIAKHVTDAASRTVECSHGSLHEHFPYPRRRIKRRTPDALCHHESASRNGQAS